MEFLKDYDCSIQYHPRKTNVVADVLSRKELALIASMVTWELVEAFSRLTTNTISERTSIYITGLTVHSHLVKQI